MAKQVVDGASVDFSLLYPLILETADKATQFNPKDVQTGPALRQDPSNFTNAPRIITKTATR